MKYVVTPTSLIANKRDQGGRFFSLRPCDFCKCDGVTLELRSYGSPIPSHLKWLIMFKQIDLKTSEDGFTTSDGYDVNYFCSEECMNLYILKGDTNGLKT